MISFFIFAINLDQVIEICFQFDIKESFSILSVYRHPLSMYVSLLHILPVVN